MTLRAKTYLRDEGWLGSNRRCGLTMRVDWAYAVQAIVSGLAVPFTYGVDVDAGQGGQTTAWIALLPVAMTAVNADWDFRIDHWGGGTKPDLFAIRKSGMELGRDEMS